ncbi:MTH1187 family thiamine-binding protein [Syntrophobacter fumaroxidans]|uniref:Thiamine-binding protein domain-containing protein n=1 Tax=Syntrophobacter fumaroxidans (strain DSM 10017 / MPOB) TaxID=335543 RepID=A0LE73_SYNFM|nr:MTH1187 family thiamine-binding protein [Syntrophobacter fumaroxidans]ABK15725.1 protein of unknown function DUF77 [Syntrophobacter fumaroxidans MPOB]HOI93453.1 MTH1187 family thiamine-binding protein [Syntrophobacter fumaroxidans]
MAVVEVSIVPIGVPGTSLSTHVAKVLKVLKESSLQYELTAMGTIVSGDLDEILPVLKRMHESCFGPEVTRVLTQIRIDDRRDRKGTPEQKIRSVMDKLTDR